MLLQPMAFSLSLSLSLPPSSLSLSLSLSLYIYIYTDKTSLKADREDWGVGDSQVGLKKG